MRTVDGDPELDRELLLEVLGATGYGWFLGQKRLMLDTGDFSATTFSVDLMAKDLRLAVEAGRTAHLPASVIEQTLRLHCRALEDGYGDKDMAAMASWFSGGAGDGSPAGRNSEGQ